MYSASEFPSQFRAHEFHSCSRKIPHAKEQLSPRSTTTAHVPKLLKPTCLEPVLYSKRSHCDDKRKDYDEE